MGYSQALKLGKKHIHKITYYNDDTGVATEYISGSKIYIVAKIKI